MPKYPAHPYPVSSFVLFEFSPNTYSWLVPLQFFLEIQKNSPWTPCYDWWLIFFKNFNRKSQMYLQKYLIILCTRCLAGFNLLVRWKGTDIYINDGFYGRFHCGANPKYGLVETMPVWWPNEVFEWTALKNLSHRFEGRNLSIFPLCPAKCYHILLILFL
jgi:hypothetical protein